MEADLVGLPTTPDNTAVIQRGKCYTRQFALNKNIALPNEGQDPSLLEIVAEGSPYLSQYTILDIRFWPMHRTLGTPDLALCFSGPQLPPFVLIVEAKLWSGKSGSGEHDPLLRYLHVLKDLHNLGLSLKMEELNRARAALLYITPHDSLPELLETSALCEEPNLRRLLFRAQWQDILEAACASHPQADRTSSLVLRDICAFLKARGLEYFRGFRSVLISVLAESNGDFYRADFRFTGFPFTWASLIFRLEDSMENAPMESFGRQA